MNSIVEASQNPKLLDLLKMRMKTKLKAEKKLKSPGKDLTQIPNNLKNSNSNLNLRTNRNSNLSY